MFTVNVQVGSYIGTVELQAKSQQEAEKLASDIGFKVV